MMMILQVIVLIFIVLALAGLVIGLIGGLFRFFKTNRQLPMGTRFQLLGKDIFGTMVKMIGRIFTSLAN
ncbi:hypothetical protein [Weissella cibaria]